MSRHAPATILEVRDLGVEFHTHNGTVTAVDGVTFSVQKGETLGLVGESGCGKTATALSIMRLLPHPAGRVVKGQILFESRDLLRMTEPEIQEIRGNRLAMIFQDPLTSLNPVLTVGRQIAEALELHRSMGRSAALDRAGELLELVGIPAAEKRLSDYPHQFSGGMRQRAMIAMALACDPTMVLADEITTALDVTIQAQILELLRNLGQERGTSFILITHDLGIVAGMTQRVHIMYAGRIVEKADTAELFRNPSMPYTWGLLRSVPRLDERRDARLTAIQGVPPDLMERPPGCRFVPRCPFHRAICERKEPDLLPLADAPESHETRCWGTQDVKDGGWLRGIDWRRAFDGAPADVQPAKTRPSHRSETGRVKNE
jgi:oligopeptide transport system ATP-binding protein